MRRHINIVKIDDKNMRGSTFYFLKVLLDKITANRFKRTLFF